MLLLKTLSFATIRLEPDAQGPAWLSSAATRLLFLHLGTPAPAVPLTSPRAGSLSARSPPHLEGTTGGGPAASARPAHHRLFLHSTEDWKGSCL